MEIKATHLSLPARPSSLSPPDPPPLSLSGKRVPQHIKEF